MPRLILLLIFLLITFNQSFGQEKEQELFLLRGMLGLSQDTRIDLKASGSLPTSNPLKVYLTTNTETQVRNNFLEWFRAWNEGEGQKYGLIEVVADFASADIALVRFTEPTVKIADTIVTEQAATEIDPTTRRPVNTPNMPLNVKYIVDVFSYIIIKEGGGPKALRRSIDSVNINSYLRSSFKESMQDRARVERVVTKAVNEGTIDSKSRKDSKAAGDRLRDDFFKLLKARDKQKK